MTRSEIQMSKKMRPNSECKVQVTRGQNAKICKMSMNNAEDGTDCEPGYLWVSKQCIHSHTHALQCSCSCSKHVLVLAFHELFYILCHLNRSPLTSTSSSGRLVWIWCMMMGLSMTSISDQSECWTAKGTLWFVLWLKIIRRWNNFTPSRVYSSGSQPLTTRDPL